jgi:phage terminase Nu1 subunit (DNA packaging protein)
MVKVPARRGHSAEEAAEHLFMSPRRFFDLVAAGIIPRATRRGYRLDDVRRRYFAHLRRGVAARESVDAGSSLVRERAALTRELREQVSIKNEDRRGDYVPVGVVRKLLVDSFDTLRSRALAICKVAPAIAFKNRDEVEAALRTEVNAALTDMADGKASR